MEFLPTAKREEEERKGRDEGRPLRLLQTSNLSTPRVGAPFLTGYALAASTFAVPVVDVSARSWSFKVSSKIQYILKSQKGACRRRNAGAENPALNGR
jgi:hypothetical protein